MFRTQNQSPFSSGPLPSISPLSDGTPRPRQSTSSPTPSARASGTLSFANSQSSQQRLSPVFSPVSAGHSARREDTFSPVRVMHDAEVHQADRILHEASNLMWATPETDRLGATPQENVLRGAGRSDRALRASQQMPGASWIYGPCCSAFFPLSLSCSLKKLLKKGKKKIS